MERATNRDVENDVVGMIPALRAYARALTRSATDADDLVQDTLMKALASIHSFTPGTMLRAWLFTIMRNTYYTSVKKRAREVTGTADCVSVEVTQQATQEHYLQGRELLAAIDKLPEHYREMLVLVVMMGESYEDAAALCGCAIGTVKSRVNRARRLVMEQLGTVEAA